MTSIQQTMPTLSLLAMQQAPAPAKAALTASSFSWQKGSMVAAVAAAVAGVAIAIFSSSALAIAGFCLLGITGSVGIFISKDILDSKKLTILTGEIAEQNQKIHQAQNEANTIITNLSLQKSSLEQAQQHLSQQLEQLKEEKASLEEQKVSLGQNNERLEAVNGLLRHTNDELNKKIGTLNSIMLKLEHEVQDFLHANNELTSSTEALAVGADDINQAHQNLAEVLDDFNEDFGLHFDQLAKQLNQAKTASEQFLIKFKQEKTSMQEQVGSLKEITEKVSLKSDELENLVNAVNDKQQMIEDFDKKILCSTDELTKLQKALDERKSEEIEKTKMLHDLISRIDGINNEISGKLIKMDDDLNSTIHDKTNAIKILDDQIHLKEKILAQLDIKIATSKEAIRKNTGTPEPRLADTLSQLKHVNEIGSP